MTVVWPALIALIVGEIVMIAIVHRVLYREPNNEIGVWHSIERNMRFSTSMLVVAGMNVGLILVHRLVLWLT